MIIKSNIRTPFKGFPKRTPCPECCGEPLTIEFDNVGNARNIILTSSHDHEEQVHEKELKEVA